MAEGKLRTHSYLSRYELYLLGIVMGLGIASNDIYLSCIPSLCKLHCIDPHVLNLTLSFYFLATAVSCLAYTFFLGALGKRVLFIVAFSAFIFACLCLSVASTGGFITMLRMLQGAAIGCIQPAVISQIKHYSRQDISSAMSSASLASEVMCTIVPIIGSLGFSYVSWRFPFLAMAFISTIVFFLVAPHFSGEQQLTHRIKRLEIGKRVLKAPNFIRFNAISGLMIGIGWSIVTISTHVYGNPLSHGAFYALYGVLYGFGCFVCEREFIASERVIRFVPMVAILCCVFLSMGLIFGSILILSIAILLFALMSGLVYGPILDRALKNIEKDQVDMASSFFTFTRLLSAGLFIVISSYIYFSSKGLFLTFIVLVFAILIALSSRRLNIFCNI